MPSPTEPVMIPGAISIKNSRDSDIPMIYVFHAMPGVYSFSDMKAQMAYSLLNAELINRNSWQTLDVSTSPAHAAHELRNVNVLYRVPATQSELVVQVMPDQPWADDHFEERVCGKPLNPAPSYKWWPHHNGTADRHVEDQVFSHTYPERFWPKLANADQGNGLPPDVNTGIRYEYGDLDDLLTQLRRNSLTRQAYLPIWFPEDTGATDRRVPCSLGYHFMSDADGQLDCWYTLRACDFYRHFTNDCYFAARLLQWVAKQVEGLHPGNLNITISSLHLFAGDAGKVNK